MFTIKKYRYVHLYNNFMHESLTLRLKSSKAQKFPFSHFPIFAKNKCGMKIGYYI